MAAIEIIFILVVALAIGILAARLLGLLARISLYILLGLIVLFLIWTILSL